MFNSIKEWINVPYQYKSFEKYTGAGTKVFSETVDSLCYPSGDVRRITSTGGVEVVSTGRLYVPGDEPIKPTDVVVFEGEERAILRINSYYRNGIVDIKVVYI